MEVAKTLKAALSTINGTLGKLKEELADTNRQIGSIEGQITDLRTMPISLEDWGGYLKTAIEEKAAKHLPMLAHKLLAPYSHTGERAENTLPWSFFENKENNILFDKGLFPEQGSVLNAMCFFFPDMIYERLMERLRACVGDRWGNESYPTVDERRKTIDTLSAQRTVLIERRGVLEAEIDEIQAALQA